jgi:hypothetical protein
VSVDCCSSDEAHEDCQISRQETQLSLGNKLDRFVVSNVSQCMKKLRLSLFAMIAFVVSEGAAHASPDVVSCADRTASLAADADAIVVATSVKVQISDAGSTRTMLVTYTNSKILSGAVPKAFTVRFTCNSATPSSYEVERLSGYPNNDCSRYSAIPGFTSQGAVGASAVLYLKGSGSSYTQVWENIFEPCESDADAIKRKPRIGRLLPTLRATLSTSGPIEGFTKMTR